MKRVSARNLSFYSVGRGWSTNRHASWWSMFDRELYVSWSWRRGNQTSFISNIRRSEGWTLALGHSHLVALEN